VHHRVAGAFNLGHSLVLLGIRLARQPHINEQAVLAIDLRRPERLGFDRYQSFAALSGRFRQQLFRAMRAEIRNSGRGDGGDLIPARFSQHGPEHDARIVGRRCVGGTGPYHLLGFAQQATDVQSPDGRRHKTEVR
jgi:hypothetical protein